MRFATVFAASFALGSAASAIKDASFQPFTVSGGDLELNPAVYTTENFTASDGETYEIVRVPLFHTRTFPITTHKLGVEFRSIDKSW